MPIYDEATGKCCDNSQYYSKEEWTNPELYSHFDLGHVGLKPGWPIGIAEPQPAASIALFMLERA
jgi:hypothetical protein